MKFFKSIILASTLLVGFAQADGFGFNIGPFSLQFDASSGEYMTIKRNTLDSPICYAISNLNRLEIVVEGTDIISAKEKKIVTKKLIVEPYAFGVTKEGKPVLRGNIVEEKLVREVTLKYGDDRFDETNDLPATKEKGFFSGLFSSSSVKNIDIRRVVEVQVLQNTHFDAPKSYKGIDDANIQVICQLPITKG